MREVAGEPIRLLLHAMSIANIQEVETPEETGLPVGWVSLIFQEGMAVRLDATTLPAKIDHELFDFHS